MRSGTLAASGGGEGLFNFSWGANGNFAALVAESLAQIDFVEELAP